MKWLKSIVTALSLLTCCVSFSQSYLPEKTNPKFKVQPSVNIKAYAFNLKDVRLLDGSPFKHAMDIDAGYLLSISPDRLLNRFYKNSH